MKTSSLLILLIAVLLVPNANAGLVKTSDGYHILENMSDINSTIIGYSHHDYISFYQQGNAEFNGQGSSASLNFWYYQQGGKAITWDRIDNITISCFVAPNYDCDDCADTQSQSAFLDYSTKSAEDVKRFYFVMYDEEVTHCYITTMWNTTFWANFGKQPPTFPALVSGWEFPSITTNICEKQDSEIVRADYDEYKIKYETIQDYIGAFLLMNWKILIIVYWFIRIFMLIGAVGLFFMIIYFLVLYIKDLIERRNKQSNATFTIRRK